MAQCFCGCGRKVRFSDKRLSEYGAQTQQLVSALKTDRVTLEGDDAPDDEFVGQLIEHGERFEDNRRGLIHRTLRPPPAAVGREQSREYYAWLETATAVLAMMRDQRERLS